MAAKQSNAATSTDDLGKLVLRIALGVMFLLHGIAKLIGGVDPITGMVGKLGFPPVLGYLVYVGEVVAPILILAGVWARAAAVVIVINMIVAILLAHTGEFFTLNKQGGWALELQGMFLATAVALALLGPGRYSLNGR